MMPKNLSSKLCAALMALTANFLEGTPSTLCYTPEYNGYPCNDAYCEYLEETSCDYCPETFLCKANTLAIQPELAYLTRKREGGTRQTGYLGGVRVNYDRIKRYKFYLGLQGCFSSGTIKGHTGTHSKIKSRWTDELIEGNVGYTFQYKYFPHFSLTPFIGGGYYRETNKFVSPTPLHLKFITEFPYLSYGFLSSVCFNNCLSIGLNARFKTPWEINCHVKNDPDFDKFKLLVGEKLQYRIELPITYCRPILCNFLELGLIPFYELRAYGGRENHPFDFFETKITLIGFNIQLIWRF